MPAVLAVDSEKTKAGPGRVKVPIRNSAKKAVIATDLSGTVLFWNQMAEEIYGWKWQEVAGRNIIELVVPNSAQPAAEKIMKQLNEGKSWTGEFSVRRRDGTEFVVKVTDKPMFDGKGNLIGLIGISHPKRRAPGVRRKSRQKRHGK